MRKLLIPLAIGLALLATGCATQNTGWEQWQQAEQARAARLDAVAGSCETDLCRVMIAQEQGKALPPPRQQHHPVWGLIDRTLSLALPMYGGYLQGRQWSDALVGVVNAVGSMDGSYTDNSVNVGRDQIGGNRVVDNSDNSDNSTHIGGDNVGRDLYSDSCVGTDCRYSSPGPIDESDNSTTDNSNTDNSTSPPPATE